MSEWELSLEVVNFSESARVFCDLMEAAHRYALAERLVRFAAAVASLYQAGLYLPFQDEPPDYDRPRQPNDVPDWVGFEELSLFWQVPDAYEWAAPKVASLNDTLKDTYREVKRGLVSFHRGQQESDADAIAYAVWDWRQSMETRWGTFLADALRALHRAIQKVNAGERDY